MAVPQLSDMKNYLRQVNIRLNNTINNLIKTDKRRLSDILNRNIFKNPINIYQTKELQFDSLIERLKFSLTSLINIKEKELIKIKNSYILKRPLDIIEKKGNKYLQIVSKLEPLSPLKTLQRGYTLTKKNNKVINSSKDLKSKDKIEIKFYDGEINAEIL